MKNKTIDNLKKCSLEGLKEKIKSADLTKLSFFELTDIVGDIYNELYFQLQPLREEMDKKYLEMKKEKAFKKAS